jgi:hypothetical protein
MRPEKENGSSPENLKENIPITGIIPVMLYCFILWITFCKDQ